MGNGCSKAPYPRDDTIVNPEEKGQVDEPVEDTPVDPATKEQVKGDTNGAAFDPMVASQHEIIFGDELEKEMEELLKPAKLLRAGVELCGQLREKQLRGRIDQRTAQLTSEQLEGNELNQYVKALTTVIDAAKRVLRRELHVATELLALGESLMVLIYLSVTKGKERVNPQCTVWKKSLSVLRTLILPDNTLAHGLTFHVRVLELGVAACPALDTVQETVKGVAKLASGAWCMDAFAVLSGGLALATAAVDLYRKRAADSSFTRIFTLHMLQSQLLQLLADPDTCRSAAITTRCADRGGGTWELACVFVNLLVNLLLGNSRSRTIMHLDNKFRKFIFCGDESFHGLVSYLSVGQPPKLEAAQYELGGGAGAAAMFTWGEEFLQRSLPAKGEKWNFGDWLERGLAQVQTRLLREVKHAMVQLPSMLADSLPEDPPVEITEDTLEGFLDMVTATQALALTAAEACAEMHDPLSTALEMAELVSSFLHKVVTGRGGAAADMCARSASAPLLKALAFMSQDDVAQTQERMSVLVQEHAASRQALTSSIAGANTTTVKTKVYYTWEMLAEDADLEPVFDAWVRLWNSERSLQEVAAGWRRVRLAASVLEQLSAGQSEANRAGQSEELQKFLAALKEEGIWMMGKADTSFGQHMDRIEQHLRRLQALGQARTLQEGLSLIKTANSCIIAMEAPVEKLLQTLKAAADASSTVKQQDPSVQAGTTAPQAASIEELPPLPRFLRQKESQAAALVDWLHKVKAHLQQSALTATAASPEGSVADSATGSGAAPQVDARGAGPRMRRTWTELGDLLEEGRKLRSPFEGQVLELTKGLVDRAEAMCMASASAVWQRWGGGEAASPSWALPPDVLREVVQVAEWVEESASSACRAGFSNSVQRALVRWTQDGMTDGKALRELLESETAGSPQRRALPPHPHLSLSELKGLAAGAASNAASQLAEVAEEGFMIEVVSILDAGVTCGQRLLKSILEVEMFMLAEVAEPLSQLRAQLLAWCESSKGGALREGASSQALRVWAAVTERLRSPDAMTDAHNQLNRLALIMERLGAAKSEAGALQGPLGEWLSGAQDLARSALGELHSLRNTLKRRMESELDDSVKAIGPMCPDLGEAARPLQRLLQSATGLLDELCASRAARRELWRVRERALSGCMLINQYLDAALMGGQDPEHSGVATGVAPIPPVAATPEVAGGGGGRAGGARAGGGDPQAVVSSRETRAAAQFLNSVLQPEIVRRRGLEPDVRVQQALAGEHLEGVVRVLQNAWPSEGKKLQAELSARVQALDELHDRLAEARDPAVQKHLLVLARGEEGQLTRCLENLRSLPAQGIGIVVHFHIRLEQKVASINVKLMAMRDDLLAMQKDVTAIRKDVRLLVGPSVDELLRKRRTQMLDSGLPSKPLVAPLSDDETPLLGELHKFLALGKDGAEVSGEAAAERQILCLVGYPGSGKSILLKLFMHQLLKDDRCVVLFCPLAVVENAHNDLVAQTLEHHYEFTDPRIGELKERARSGDVKLLICADGLDESPPYVQQANLFEANRLAEWGKEGGKWPKLLITCRNTHFPSDPDEQKARFTISGSADELKSLRIGNFQKRIKSYCEAVFQWRVNSLLSAVLNLDDALDPIQAGEVSCTAPPETGMQPASADVQACIEHLEDSTCRAEYAPVLQRYADTHAGCRLDSSCQDAIRQAGIWTTSQYIKRIKVLPDELTNTVFMIEMLIQVLPRIYHPIRLQRMGLEKRQKQLNAPGSEQPRSRWRRATANAVTHLRGQNAVTRLHEQTFKYDIYEEFMKARLETEVARAGMELSMSRDQFFHKVLRWCEELAVHMMELEVTQVQASDEASPLNALLNDSVHRLSRQAAPLTMGEEDRISWLHLTIGDFFAARQILSGLDRMQFFCHDGLMAVLLEKLNHLIGKDQQGNKEEETGPDPEDVKSGQQEPSTKTYRDLESWIISSDLSLLDLLDRDRRDFVKLLRAHAIPGLFKPHEASNALQDLIGQLRRLESNGLNRCFIQNLPEVEKFLVEAIVREPRHEKCLEFIIQLSRYQPSFLRAAEGALHLLGSAHLSLIQSHERSLSQAQGLTAEHVPLPRLLHEPRHFGQTYLHVLASRSPEVSVVNAAVSQPGKPNELMYHVANQLADLEIMNAADLWGRTPLDCVVVTLTAVPSRIEWLVRDHRAKLRATVGSALWDLYQEHGYEEVVEMIPFLQMAKADLHAKNRDGITLLHKAVEDNNIGLARALLENTRDPNPNDRDHTTPLEALRRRPQGERSVAMEVLLVDYGGTTLRIPNSAMAKLVQSSDPDDVDKLKTLLQESKACADRCPDGEDPVLLASEAKNWSAVSALLPYSDRESLELELPLISVFHQVFKGLAENMSIQSLTLRNSQVDSDKVVQLVRSKPLLAELNLLTANMSEEAIPELVKYLKDGALHTVCGIPRDVTSMDLSEQQIGDTGWMLLAAEVGVRRSLSTLNVWGIGAQVEGARALVDAVKQRK
eukprot:gene1871-2540_t